MLIAAVVPAEATITATPGRLPSSLTANCSKHPLARRPSESLRIGYSSESHILRKEVEPLD
jgi:hypothetical protein